VYNAFNVQNKRTVTLAIIAFDLELHSY